MSGTQKTFVGVFVGIVIGIIITIAVTLCVLWTGALDWSATKKPFPAERWAGNFAWENSMNARAPKDQNPFGHDEKAIDIGLDHYREDCVICHRVPGTEASDVAMGLHPAAPDLWKPETQSMTDGQLFWTIKNGIRMTGMPGFGVTHSDTNLWNLVAFIRQLPKLTPEQKEKLQSHSHSKD